MTIQYASDLHLEFPENHRFLKENPLQPKGDVLVLAGDIVPFALMNKFKDFFQYVSDHFPVVYWIPGNHEYYHFDIANKCGILREKIRSNVFLVNNMEVQHKGVSFVFSTLWSRIDPARQWYIEKAMNDFQVIKYEGFRFSIDRFNKLHEECINFMKQAKQRDKADKTVAVTHHVPTLLNYPKQYIDSDLNEAFAVELSDFIETTDFDYWIYGHHHSNTQDFSIGKTKLITNQLGYVQYGEHAAFKTGAVIDS